MLARAGAIPSGVGWRYEPKVDGYRCLVCTHGRFRARSRRGWNMTTLLPELEAALPGDVQLDGEIIATGPDGHPDFHRLGRRTAQPYRERRELLDALELNGPQVQIVPSFDDGQALCNAVCAH